MRVAFFTLLAGTLSVLYVDYRALTEGEGAAPFRPMQPILPPFNRDAPAGGAIPVITSSPAVLEAPLAIALGAGGVLSLTGTFDPGSADRFASEIAARGEYVRTVVLDSPGGAVVDALTIGALIHEQGLATSVAAGALCASSCPIVFAGGKERIATPQSAIGVHQIYAAALSADQQNGLQRAGSAMADAQQITADITRHLALTGVDPALWLHALETPPDRLYYFSAEEMIALNLVTDMRQN
ncbi:hypothetical protein VW29_03365 [Devosia limi DSM 17137]|nr:ATP-dependent Clp protease proteolytic subunit [Devosia limi]KKB86306.1 hypothetical protein VW29_03080 [Devosia limi DSM 17137]KKB86314.1 hypothetical protein VW29_03365 [Devosia limi DSM 17137]